MITIETKNPTWNTETEYVEYADSFDYYRKHGHSGFEGLQRRLAQKEGQGEGAVSNRNFNTALYSLVPIKPMKLLDVGCGSGRLVEDCINDGHMAYGIDANFWYRKLGTHSWGRFPDHFFLADAGKEFTLYENNEVVKFDVITSWEFFEHIRPTDLGQLVKNIGKHSRVGTWLIFSANQFLDLPWHKTIKNKKEWADVFKPEGFESTDIDFKNNVSRCIRTSVYCYLRKTT